MIKLNTATVAQKSFHVLIFTVFSMLKQVKMYEAFTSAFMSVGWNMGAIFWHWDFDMNAGKTHSRGGYTPQNKPARFVLRRKFSKYC